MEKEEIMGLGTITTYKVGFKSRGISITRIFPEHVSRNYKTGLYTYYPTTYYVMYNISRGVGPEPWFLEEYQINTLLNRYIKYTLLKKRLHKMLDKKYESCKRKSRLPSHLRNSTYKKRSRIR